MNMMFGALVEHKSVKANLENIEKNCEVTLPSLRKADYVNQGEDHVFVIRYYFLASILAARISSQKNGGGSSCSCSFCVEVIWFLVIREYHSLPKTCLLADYDYQAVQTMGPTRSNEETLHYQDVTWAVRLRRARKKCATSLSCPTCLSKWFALTTERYYKRQEDYVYQYRAVLCPQL
ncbi:hypothetical protein R1flu_025316 [Riccia fluitans]|uniref:Uncharacterized protein n=1 Tax=Riccia fluitans TaxID=41844 RepID=A0ABD1XXE6_9MARC